MRERVLRRALLCSIAALAVPATASAATFNVSPNITGAGSVTALNSTCTQAPPVSDSAVYDCPQSWKTSDPLDVKAAAADGWKFLTWTGCTSVAETVCTVTDPGGGKVMTVRPVAYFADVRKPTVTQLTAVPSTEKDLTEIVSWDADEPGVSYKCGKDGAKPVPCTSPLTFEAVDQHRHYVNIVATDPSGLTSSATSIEFTTLDTTLADGPAPGSITRDDSAVFHAASAIRNATFDCALDGAAFHSCGGSTITLNKLADGKHELRVRAASDGSYDGVPAVRTWTVDTTPPDTQLSVKGDTLEFKASEPGATLECRLDGGLFIACTSPQPLPKLAPGEHVFEVRALDALGNADATPARSAWTVAAPALPTPTPAPVVLPAAPVSAPVAIAAPAAKPTLAWRYRKGRFTRLEVIGVAKVTVAVTSPNGKKRTLSSLKPLIGKRLAPGTKIAVIGKTITIRRGRPPKVA